MASQNSRTAKNEAQARLRERKKEYVEKLERENQQLHVILEQLARTFGFSADELTDLPQIMQRNWTSDAAVQKDISEFYISLARLRCRLLFSGSIRAMRHTPHQCAVGTLANTLQVDNSSSAWTAPLDGMQDRRLGQSACNLRFILHSPYEPV